jgi:hypothetical protein
MRAVDAFALHRDVIDVGFVSHSEEMERRSKQVELKR